MKQKIKTWLIHWLGGVTAEEKQLAEHRRYYDGINDERAFIKAYAKSLYGKDPESWCQSMWNYINTQTQKIENND